MRPCICFIPIGRVTVSEVHRSKLGLGFVIKRTKDDSRSVLFCFLLERKKNETKSYNDDFNLFTRRRNVQDMYRNTEEVLP